MNERLSPPPPNLEGQTDAGCDAYEKDHDTISTVGKEHAKGDGKDNVTTIYDFVQHFTTTSVSFFH